MYYLFILFSRSKGRVWVVPTYDTQGPGKCTWSHKMWWTGKVMAVHCLCQPRTVTRSRTTPIWNFMWWPPTVFGHFCWSTFCDDLIRTFGRILLLWSLSQRFMFQIVPVFIYVFRSILICQPLLAFMCHGGTTSTRRCHVQICPDIPGLCGTNNLTHILEE